VRANDRWSEGMTPDTYIDQMTQNRDIFTRRIEETELSSNELQLFQHEPLRVLILTEDFCGDSAQFIPPVIRLAQVLENVEVRILLRNEHQDLATDYRRRDGYQAIPVLILMDAAGHELGALVERPARVYDAMAVETRSFAKEHPELEGVNRSYERMPPETKARVRSNMDHFRASQQSVWTRWLLEDLGNLVAAGRSRLVAAGAV
jgi:hypothetical protein